MKMKGSWLGHGQISYSDIEIRSSFNASKFVRRDEWGRNGRRFRRIKKDEFLEPREQALEMSAVLINYHLIKIKIYILFLENVLFFYNFTRARAIIIDQIYIYIYMEVDFCKFQLQLKKLAVN